MDTESIVRRIIELKKVSVELKQTTQDPTMSNSNLISSLLQFGKSISAFQNKQQKQKQKKSIQSPSLNGPSDREPSQNQPNILLQLFQNQNKKQSLHRSELESSVSGLESSSVGRLYQEPLTPVQQINYLRQNNSDIEQEIKNLRDKLRRLQEIQRQQREEDWKDGLPYFASNIPKLRIFYTKLTIEERDYDKIDYCLYSVNLNLDKIVLTQLPQTQISNRPPKSITLMLTDLKEVNYHNKKNSKKNPFGFSHNEKIKQDDDDLLIVYHFKHKKVIQSRSRSKSGKKSAFSRAKVEDKIKEEDDEIVETLFVKFNSEDQLKQWDLGVFVNYKIMEDLNKGETKVESSMNSSTIAYEEPSKKKQSENEKGKNVQFNDLVEKMNKKVVKTPQNKTLQSENESDDQAEENKNGRKPPSLDKNYFENYNDEDIPGNKNKGSNIKIVDEDYPIMENRDESMQEEIINKQRANTSHFGGLVQAMSMQQKVKLAQQQKVQEEEARKQKLAEIQQNKRREAERMEELRKTEYELSVKKARQSLRKGYIVTKYAKSAFSPHEKKMYLSEDGKMLCWKDLNGQGEFKSIKINQILTVTQATYGKGMESHITFKKFNENKGSYAVITLKSKDRKYIDISTKDQPTTEAFCKDLQLYRKNIYSRQ